jgi:crotonobetainyl-CoA:carnitine CoA-transferase CaiB-like acyl-CoA transferase
MRPLEDITVVALEQAVAAPFATRHLADLGARVIKIERPGTGDFAREYDTRVQGLSSHFAWLNRTKQSLSLDVKQPAGKDVLQRLLERADVFVHNLAPGAVERLGFGKAAVTAAFPRLIVCEISGYGATGPFRDKRAYDLLVQSEAGLLAITGTQESPAKAGIAVADIAGGMYAFSGILAALIERARTGRGSVLEISLFDSLVEWMGYPLYYASGGAGAPPRTGAHHATIAPYGPYPTGDGQTVYVAVQNDREWRRFCAEILGDPTIADDPRFVSNGQRIEHRPELDRIIISRFAALGAGEAVDMLDRAQIACAHMNTIEQAREHPQLVARGRWRQVESPKGPVPALMPPIAIGGEPPAMGPIPNVGEHTDSILEEIGVPRSTIDALRQRGVI